MTAIRNRLFVYGTLRPGDVRWPILAPYVDDDGADDSVAGRLFDTGRGYPAAVFADGMLAGSDPDSHGTSAPNTVRQSTGLQSKGPSATVYGRTYALRTERLADALAALDHEEGTVAGLYHRVVVTTEAGVDAWAYSYGDGLELTPIESGDWLTHPR